MPLLISRAVGSALSFGLTGASAGPPGAPTIGTATATSSSSATVSYTAPANNGGKPITSYTAISTPGCKTGTLNQACSGTITVNCLSPSTSYTFRVKATNSKGCSPYSSASNSITTSALIGSQLYVGGGTSTWVAPAGVTSVSVLLISGSACGQNAGYYCCSCLGRIFYAGGGGGGASSVFINNYSVTPGNSYNFKAGTPSRCSATGRSYWISSCYASANGPAGVTGGIPSGSAVTAGSNGFFGGFGGACRCANDSSYKLPGSGGGGAGRSGRSILSISYYTPSGNYSSHGGAAGCSYTGQPPNGYGVAGAGGDGGGGGTGFNSFSSCIAGSGGGGVGYYAVGSAGAAGAPGSGGGGGSGGNSGSSVSSGRTGGAGGTYGGGGGGGGLGSSYNFGTGGSGTSGVVRIVWPGNSRQFPSTCVGTP